MTVHVTEDLGLYAASLLDPEERLAVARHLDACAECRAALAAEERLAWTLADAASRATPPALRERIVAHHAASRHRFFAPWPTGARVVLALATVALVVLGAGLQAARTDRDREAALTSEYQAVVAAIAQGGRVVPLEPSTGTSGKASVIVSGSGQAYLVFDMPAPPDGKAYEAWIIRDGAPAPAGVAPARSGLVVLPLTAVPRSGDVAAVTVEDVRGATKPTSDPILVGKL